MKQYGKAIKTLRRNADMTQAQLAQKLNVSAQTVSKWENEVNLPDIFVIEEICSLFGVAMEEFINLAENGVQTFAGQAQEEVAQANEVSEEYTAPTANVYGASAATSATVRTRDKRLWIVIVAAVIGSIIAITALIAPIIVLFTKSSGKGVYEKVNPSVFCITVQTDDDTTGGSGFFIDKKGTAVTNYHVIEGIKSAKVRLYDGMEYNVDKIIGHDTVRDIAVIHVDINKSIPVSFADSNKIKTGDKVYAIGYPQSSVSSAQDSTMTAGIISKTSYSLKGVDYIQSNVDITHGNSGGVLVNANGKVIGMTTADIDYGNITYMNLSVPSNAVTNVKKDINLSVENYAKKYSKKFKLTYLLDGKQFAEKYICAADSIPELTVDLTAQGEDYEGCEFLGWFADDKFTQPFDFTATAETDLMLYAKVRFKNYTVAFYGGSGATGSVASATVKSGESYTLPENRFTRSGYKFVGWKFDGILYNVGDTVVSDGSRAVLNVEAEWLGITYNVSFEYEGQKIEQTYRYGEQHRVSDASFTRTGYTQTGWKCNGITFPLEGEMPDLTNTENATVICEPVWTPIKYKMRLYFDAYSVFMGEGYNKGDFAEITCNYGRYPFDGYDDPESSALDFEGWTVCNADGSVYEGDLRYVNPDPDVIVRAKANWVSGSYSIHLYAGQNASDPTKIIPMKGREECPLPLFSTFNNIEHRKGYHFGGGWKFERNIIGEEPIIFEDGATVSDLMMLGDYFGGSYSGYRVKLKTVWLPDEYVISFEGDGAQGNMADFNCVYDEEFTLPSNTFTKQGYTFLGWQFGDSIFNDGQTVSNVVEGDGNKVIFTALWIKAYEGDGTETNPYKISSYEQLKNVSDAVEHINGYRSAHYELTADIDCGGGELYAIGHLKSFRGVFDGKGHVVKNAVFAATYGVWSEFLDRWDTAYKGLFGHVFGGQIKNLGLKDYVINGADGCTMIAPLVCKYTSGLPLQSCFAEGTISWQDDKCDFAGLVYALCGRAVNCYSVCTFDMKYTHSVPAEPGQYAGDISIGGFVGNISGAGKWSDDETTINITQSVAENCYADAHINISVAPSVFNVYRHYMGLFCAGTGIYKNCFSTGEINYDCSYDFANKLHETIYKSYLVGLFDGNHYFPTYDNVYVADSAKIAFTDEVFTDVPERQNKTETANLYSLEWLKTNMAFDETVWKENAEGLPTLRVFG